jgi:predicted dehydrogenase
MAIDGRSDAALGKIKYGMVGGGEGAFIGAVHRLAARMDDHYVLAAGALSSSPEKAIRSAKALGIDPERCYGDYETMAAAEQARKDGIEAVAIVTPNHVHVPAARAFLKAGIHVICDKPLSTSLRDALALAKLVKSSGLVFCLTHNYTGYPMVRHARQMVQDGDLGEIRVVQAEYPQDWLTEPIEKTGQKQASWRTDPKQSGGGAIGDIGTHAHNLAAFVSGLELDSVLADVDTFVKGRKVDDNVNVLLRYKGGAKGMLWASQVAVGNENNVKVRVYGTKGGLEWHQEHPNHLHWFPYGKAPQLITRGSPSANAAANRVTRVPPGHPEGYLEGFANIYTEAAAAIRAARSKKKPDKAVTFPTINDGVKGMAFIEAVLKSSAKGGKWIKLTA